MTFRILLLTFLVLPLSTGCTILGGIMGATMTNTPLTNPHAFDQIPIGSQVEVALIGGERVAGQVTGYTERGEYPPPASASRPLLGDSVVIADISGREVTCVLFGFHRRALAVGCSGMSLEVPYTSVRHVSWGRDRSLDGDALREVADAGALPMWRALRLATNEGPRIVPLDHVVRVRNPLRSRHLVLGIAIGLAADVLIGSLIWSQIEFPFTMNWDSQ